MNILMISIDLKESDDGVSFEFTGEADPDFFEDDSNAVVELLNSQISLLTPKIVPFINNAVERVSQRMNHIQNAPSDHPTKTV